MYYAIAAIICFLAAMAMLLNQIWRLGDKVDELNARLLTVEQRKVSAGPSEAIASHVNIPKFL